MLQKCEWESEVSSLAYYKGAPEDYRGQALSAGIYLVRHVRSKDLDQMEALNFDFLDCMVDLEWNHPQNAITWTTLDVSCVVGKERLRCRDWFVKRTEKLFLNDKQFLLNNRLIKTLPREEALELMRRWIWNSFTSHCKRIGVCYRKDFWGVLKPAGFITLHSTPMLDKVDLMAVLPEFRGKGVGKHLALWAVSKTEADVVQVRTEIWNGPAIGSYQWAGFRVTGHENVYWKSTG